MISLPKLLLIHFQGVSSLSVIEVMFCGKLLSCSHLTATIKDTEAATIKVGYLFILLKK